MTEYTEDVESESLNDTDWLKLIRDKNKTSHRRPKFKKKSLDTFRAQHKHKIMDNVKRIHIKTKNGAKETVMFSEKATVEEVHGVLVTLLDLPMEYNGQLKLTKADGAAVKISPEIPVNSANEPYALEVAGTSEW